MSAKRSGERMARSVTGCSPAWPPDRWAPRSPSRCTPRWLPSPTSGSPRATRWPSPIWCTPPPGARCTTRRLSPPVCSTPSPWGSGRPRAWWPTPSATGWWSAGPTSTPVVPTPGSRRQGRAAGGGARRTCRAAGRVLGTRHRHRDSGAHRRGAALVEHGGPGPSGRSHPHPTGGAGHRRGARRPGEGGGTPDGSGVVRPQSTVAGLGRRGAASQATADRLPGVVTGADPPPLPDPARGKGWPTTCGRSGWPRTPRPCKLARTAGPTGCWRPPHCGRGRPVTGSPSAAW